MHKSLLIVMLDVMVMSVLALTVGGGQGRSILPIHKWSTLIEKGIVKEKSMTSQIRILKNELERATERANSAEIRAELAAERERVASLLSKEAEAKRAAFEVALFEAKEDAKQAEIKAGIAAEKQRTADIAAREALERQRIADEQARRAETIAREAEVEAARAVEREKVAKSEAEKLMAQKQLLEQRAGEAEEAAHQAELRAKAAEEKRTAALAETERARAKELEFQKTAEAAREELKKVELQINTANLRHEEAQRIIEEAKTKEAVATKEASEATKKTKVAELKLAEIEAIIKNAGIAEAKAREREQEALARLEESRVAEGKALESARQALKMKEEALDEAKLAKQELESMQGDILDARIGAEVATAKLDAAVTEKERVTKELEQIEEDRQKSVWLLRDNAMFKVRFQMEEAPPDQQLISVSRRDTLHLPMIKMGNSSCVVANMSDLGLTWWHLQQGGNISGVVYLAAKVEGSDNFRLFEPMFIENSAPGICYLPFTSTNLPYALEPIGTNRLKQDRVQEALLFKVKDPNSVITVSLVPELVSDFVKVKLAERGPRTIFSRTRIDEGDYLLTTNGKFIGVMVSKNLCYIIPSEMPESSELFRIPVAPQPGQQYFRAFVNAAIEARKTMRKNKR